GMAQDGALYMGRAGATLDQIVQQFYPGTAYGRAGGPVRVAVWSGDPAAGVGVTLPTGGFVSSSTPTDLPLVVPPGGRLLLTAGPAGYTARLLDPAAPRARPVAFALAADPGLTSGPTTPVSLEPTPSLTPSASTSASPSATSSSSTPATTSTNASPKPSSPPPASHPATSTAPAPTGSRPASQPPPPPPGPLPPVPGSDQSHSGTAGPGLSAPVQAPLVAPPPPPAPPGSLNSAGPPTVSAALGGTLGVDPTGRHYRGVLSAALIGPTLHLVDAVDLEAYLGGLGEIRDPSWPASGLQAQAVAARSFAAFAMAAHLPSFDLWDDDRSQVYLGSDAEYAALSAAVAKTRGMVLNASDRVIQAFYSSNGGGVSATTEEGFGTPDSAAYLPARAYPTDDVGSWQLNLPMSELAAKLGYPGQLGGVAVVRRGPSGRALTVGLDGSAGRQERSGLDVQRALHLRSTLFDPLLPPAVAAASPIAAERVVLPPAPPAAAFGVGLSSEHRPSKPAPSKLLAVALGLALGSWLWLWLWLARGALSRRRLAPRRVQPR
ncbi:MAG: SpoIID/LytB domain-containing protein, partial [Actinomycetota bacterium]|nr:SpoIID/LytB domain-containing protein [Actinomycetota bacterium]